MSKLAFRAQTVDIAYLPLRQDLLAKNVLMTAQRDFRLGNSPSLPDRAHRRYQNHLFGPESALNNYLVAMFQISEAIKITIHTVRSPLPKGGETGYSTGINQSSHNHFTQPAPFGSEPQGRRLRALATLNNVEGERARDYHIPFLFTTKA